MDLDIRPCPQLDPHSNRDRNTDPKFGKVHNHVNQTRQHHAALQAEDDEGDDGEADREADDDNTEVTSRS